MGLYSMVFSSLRESFPSGQALGNDWMKFNIVVTGDMIKIVVTGDMINIVVTGDMIEEIYYNNSIFISNTQLISNERSITERIIYNIPLVFRDSRKWWFSQYENKDIEYFKIMYFVCDDSETKWHS